MPTIITNSIRTSKCPTSLTSMHGASSLLTNHRDKTPLDKSHPVQSSPVVNPPQPTRQVSNSMAFNETPRINKIDQKLPHMTPMVTILQKKIKEWHKRVRKTRDFLSSRWKMSHLRSNRRTYSQMKNNKFRKQKDQLLSSSLIHRLSKPISCLILKMTHKRVTKHLLIFCRIMVTLIRQFRQPLSITILKNYLPLALRLPGKATRSLLSKISILVEKHRKNMKRSNSNSRRKLMSRSRSRKRNRNKKRKRLYPFQERILRLNSL